MHPTARFLLFVVATTTFLLASLANALQHHRHAAIACIPHEREALLAFKRGITSDEFGLLDSWQEGDQQDCCRWRGVRCSNRTGHVLKLGFRTNGAPIDRDELLLTGQISPSLLALEHLEHLDLSNNELEGPTGSIPEFLGSLKNLRHLDLSGIPFSGSLPPSLSNLSNLQYLNLSGVPFSGRLSPSLGNLSNLQYLDLSSDQGDTISADLSWLKHLPSLQYLNLNFVNLSMVADWPHVVNMIPSLRVLDLSFCWLTNANQSLPHLNLTNIEELDLSGNYFDHPVASSWFWNIKRLKRLYVGWTHLYGQFPNVLENMTSLTVLDFSKDPYDCLRKYRMELVGLRLALLNRGNVLHGDATELFVRLLHWSSNKLQELNLSGNNITGVLPNRMGQFTSLVSLDLSSNNITGRLPACFGHFTSLRTLDLSFNHLTGVVPHEIGLLSNLISLDLSKNKLDGVLTEEHFARLNSLQDIDLSYNSLEIEISSEWQPPFRLRSANFAACRLGPLFPSWLRWSVDLKSIDISSAGIVDTIPDWFSNVFSNVIDMNISSNYLYGGLPTNMETMSLEELYLDSNQLTGHIPSLPINLSHLDISNNLLNEPLPLNFGVPNLEVLSLSSNRITGRIPRSICKCTALTDINLASNFFEGGLPSCLRKTEVKTLQLMNNSLSGTFPPFLRSCTALKFLDLSKNKLSGRLPTWIGELVGLQFLRLSHNRFSGSIPTSITGLTCLQYLDLGGNGISGSLPGQMSNLTSMRRRYRDTAGLPHQVESCAYDMYTLYHGVTLPEVTKGHELNYGPYSNFMEWSLIGIDLYLNNLSGELPEDIAALDALQNLNLSWNHLSGKIPNKIGTMQSLESLDLSRNKLSGQIPASLSNLTFLEYLDLSYNNLTGRIPPGSQLDTLYASKPSMYDGNIGLCGAPLNKNCSSPDASRQGRHSRTTDDGRGHETFWYGLGLGFTTGLWVVFCAILFSRACRFTLFSLVDMLHDKVYVFVAVTCARLVRKRATGI